MKGKTNYGLICVQFLISVASQLKNEKVVLGEIEKCGVKQFSLILTVFLELKLCSVGSIYAAHPTALPLLWHQVHLRKKLISRFKGCWRWKRN